MVTRFLDGMFGGGSQGQRPSGNAPSFALKGLTSGRKKRNVFIVNGKEYLEEQLISEGGYGYVYRVSHKSKQEAAATDGSEATNGGSQTQAASSSGGMTIKNQYALKRMFVQDQEAVERVQKEAELWKKIGSHPNIVEYIDSQLVQRFDPKRGTDVTEMLIVCSLCQGGFTLIDMIEQCNGEIPEHVVLTIMGDICRGVAHMHQMGISHRDLKVENILLSDQKFKVADFGSSESQENFLYWSKLEGMEAKARQIHVFRQFETFEKNTTLLYRPPEMMDQYQRKDIDFKADIWMLGCILYTLCFARHPFQEAQTLAIINGQYKLPEEEERISANMKKLIQALLQTNPDVRPTIEQVIQIIENLKNKYKSDNAQEIKKVYEKFSTNGTAQSPTKISKQHEEDKQNEEQEEAPEQGFDFGSFSNQQDATDQNNLSSQSQNWEEWATFEGDNKNNQDSFQVASSDRLDGFAQENGSITNLSEINGQQQQPKEQQQQPVKIGQSHPYSSPQQKIQFNILSSEEYRKQSSDYLPRQQKACFDLRQLIYGKKS